MCPPNGIGLDFRQRDSFDFTVLEVLGQRYNSCLHRRVPIDAPALEDIECLFPIQRPDHVIHTPAYTLSGAVYYPLFIDGAFDG